jgi:PIF1-like helicase
MECFQEAVTSGSTSPVGLRNLFVTLTVNGFSTLNILIDSDLRESMLDDYSDDPHNRNKKYIKFLTEIRKKLRKENKELEDYGLQYFPGTHDVVQLDNITELDDYKNKYNTKEQLILYNQLTASCPLNDEQQFVFDNIIKEVMSPALRISQGHKLIHGAAGTGKSVLTERIAAYCRAQGKIVLICSSTTLGATIFADAETGHYTFAYPVVDEKDDEDEKPQCQLHLTKYKQRRDLLMAADVIAYDEVFGSDRHMLESIYDVMQENIKLVWVFIGDTRQTLPIVTYGKPQDIINATLTSSYMWNRFDKYFLTENRRLTMTRTEDMTDSAYNFHCMKQEQWAKLLLVFGEGTPDHDITDVCELVENVTTTCISEHVQRYSLPTMKYYLDTEKGIEEAIQWLYPERNVISNNIAKDRVLLAMSNDRVNFWNGKLQELNPNQLHCLRSHDYFADVDDDNNILNSLLTDTILNKFHDNHTPDHMLNLKEGDICLLARPLRAYGLASNQRVYIHKIPITTNNRPPRLIEVYLYIINIIIVILTEMFFIYLFIHIRLERLKLSQE